ncbi:ExeA family protein [uncultured Deefgea sp.]|uniref:ExeA family protein n=1 Tax=uncultured Deefgea sp. TaxID=1304914 RepID=UPI002598D418|nr:AAA family ATPase [uncultured Deefgea sp.]
MYQTYFGLHSPPFRLTSHPDFFFLGAGRGDVLNSVLSAIEAGEGLIQVIAEIGAGKTLLCRMLLARLSSRVDAIFLPHQAALEHEFLITIAAQLQIHRNASSCDQVMDQIETELIRRHAAGRRVVLLLDAAHAMPLESFELLRLLSDLAVRSRPLLQMVLFARPEFEQQSVNTAFSSLRQRVSHNLVLPLFTTEDVTEYLACRLSAAGYQGETLFSAAAVQLIAKAAHGLSRQINLIADQALLAACTDHAVRVEAKHVQSVLQDPSASWTCFSPIWRWLAILLIGALSLLFWHFYPNASQINAPLLWPTSAKLASLSENAEIKARVATAPVLLNERVMRSNKKLIAADASSVTILVSKVPQNQLLRLEQLVSDLEVHLGANRVLVYPTLLNGSLAWGVLAGLYPDINKAQAMAQRLEHAHPQRKSKVQTIGVLRGEMLLLRD